MHDFLTRKIDEKKLTLFSDFEFANTNVNLSYTECVIVPISAIMDTLLQQVPPNAISMPMKTFTKDIRKMRISSTWIYGKHA